MYRNTYQIYIYIHIHIHIHMHKSYIFIHIYMHMHQSVNIAHLRVEREGVDSRIPVRQCVAVAVRCSVLQCVERG